MGMALVTQHILNSCHEDYGNVVLTTEGIPESSNETECLVIKVSRQMHNDTFKRRLAFILTVIVSA